METICDKRRTVWWESKWLTVALVFVICLWRIPFLNKGIDCLDTGYSMENYINVFQGNGVSGLGTALTTLIGGVIYALLPAYQLLVFRVLHWLIGLATIFFAFRIFKKYLPTNLILVVLLGINLGAKSGEAIYSYYPMTTLLLLMSVYLLLKGINENSRLFLALSGLVSGINIFFRLPNLLFLSMAFGVIWFDCHSGKKIKDIVIDVAAYAVGVIASLIVTIPLMVALLGTEKLTASFMEYVRLALGETQSSVVNPIGITEKSGHSLVAEVKTIARQGLFSLRTAAASFGLFAICGAIIDKASKAIKNTELRRYVVLIMQLVLALVSILLFRNWIYADKMCIMGLFSIVLSIYLAIRLRKTLPDLSTVFLLNIMLGICVVFGSDLGLNRFGVFSTYMSLSGALALYVLWNKKEDIVVFERIRLSSKLLIKAGTLLLLGFYVTNIYIGMPRTFGDADFSELKYSVNDNITAFRGMKTSLSRRNAINEYYELMSSDIMADKEVAVFGYFALGFAIAPHTDYFEAVQPCIDYPAVSVESLLKVINEKEEANIAPVIVVSYVNQLYRNDDHYTTEAKAAVLNYMLSLHEYEVYSESEYFTIYIPKQYMKGDMND